MNKKFSNKLDSLEALGEIKPELDLRSEEVVENTAEKEKILADIFELNMGAYNIKFTPTDYNPETNTVTYTNKNLSFEIPYNKDANILGQTLDNAVREYVTKHTNLLKDTSQNSEKEKSESYNKAIEILERASKKPISQNQQPKNKEIIEKIEKQEDEYNKRQYDGYQTVDKGNGKYAYEPLYKSKKTNKSNEMPMEKENNHNSIENTEKAEDLALLKQRLKNYQRLLELKKNTESTETTTPVLQPEIIKSEEIEDPTLDVEAETLLGDAPQDQDFELKKIQLMQDPEKQKSAYIEYTLGKIALSVDQSAVEKIKEYVDRILNETESRDSVVKGLPPSFVKGIDDLLAAHTQINSVEEEALIDVTQEDSDVEKTEPEKEKTAEVKENQIEQKESFESFYMMSPIDNYFYEPYKTTEIKECVYSFNKKSESESDFEILISGISFDDVARNRENYIKPACDEDNVPEIDTLVNIITLKKGKVSKEGDKWVIKEKALIRYVHKGETL